MCGHTRELSTCIRVCALPPAARASCCALRALPQPCGESLHVRSARGVGRAHLWWHLSWPLGGRSVPSCHRCPLSHRVYRIGLNIRAGWFELPRWAVQVHSREICKVPWPASRRQFSALIVSRVCGAVAVAVKPLEIEQGHPPHDAGVVELEPRIVEADCSRPSGEVRMDRPEGNETQGSGSERVQIRNAD